MYRIVLTALIALALGIATPVPTSAANPPAAHDAYRPLPKPGKQIPIDANHYFTYGFTKSPKLGMCIMKVEIFTRDGKRDTSFLVKGDADMPSMRGAHASGDKLFSVSNKGVYLLPVNLVMPGDWEVRLTLAKNGKELLRGAYLFDL